jgi:probable HAF family extracellular repeat protein/uncharacterized repeat protein (TIGR03803 family)
MLAGTAIVAHAQYTAYYLGTLPEGPDSAAYGINNAGTIVGQSDNAGGIRAFIYSGGVMTDLGTLGGPDSWAGAINNAGTIVGYAYNSSPEMHAFSYSGGVMTDLDPSGGVAQANGINDAGTIVGFIGNDAFSYSGGVMTDLGPGVANGINSAGTIVGAKGNDAFSYSGGMMTNLGPGVANGINSAGTIVGSSGNLPVSWSGGVMTVLGTFSGTSSGAYGINSAGTIVGCAYTSNGVMHAFSYSGGVMTDLAPCLVSIGIATSSFSRAMAINDNGYIVGWGYSNYIARAYLLVPVCSCIGSNTVVATTGFTNLWDFTNGSDGAYPQAGLILSGNTLYGTTGFGGSSGYGTVFSVNTDGTDFTNLHSFTFDSDGAYTQAGLILSGNTLYGTAVFGGSLGWGTVFSVQTNGTDFTNLHNFTDGTDGGHPLAGLILSGNTLYGTTDNGGSFGDGTVGGSYGDGTVFSVQTNGTDFTNLHSFTALAYNAGLNVYTNSDGANPQAGLILSGNTLYGTASVGGSSGWGTVFSVNTNGTDFTTLYSFTNGADGGFPLAGLILSGNTLYGTTEDNNISGYGTVFSIQTNGTDFTNLHSFTALAYNAGLNVYTNSDGANPWSGLILSGNTLYGTAGEGGSSGAGTVFSVNTNGTDFTILFSFTRGSDGASPLEGAGLILSGNTLYGTTDNGGSSDYGTVFALSFTNWMTNCLQIQCPGDIVVTSCVPIQEFYTNTVTDLDCSNVIVWCNPTNGSYFAPGTTNWVTCYATDCCGNSNSCSFAVTVNYATNCCVQQPANMVLWLPFDETSGTTSANLKAPEYPGTQVGNPTPIVGAYVDNSLWFNGVNQYVSVPDYPAIEIGTNDFTIDAWVQCATNVADDIYTIVDKRTISGNAWCGYIFDAYFGNLLIELDAGRFAGNNVDTCNLPADGQWHLVAVTVQRTSTNGIQFYIDGQPTSTSNPTDHESSLSNNAPLLVGGSILAGTYWLGGLDEVEVFNRALAGNEIAGIYNAGTNGKCKCNCTALPVITCPDTIYACTYTSNVQVSYIPAPTATNPCTGSNVTVVCNPTNGSYFALGTTNVTCVAANCYGTTNCTFTVTVCLTNLQVNIAPSLTNNPLTNNPSTNHGFWILNPTNFNGEVLQIPNLYIQTSTNPANTNWMTLTNTLPYYVNPTNAEGFYRLFWSNPP